MSVDTDDRHLLAVVAVWAVVIGLTLLGGAVVLGLAVRLFVWVLQG